ncbi:MAG: hypothetical protein SGJ17_10150 [Hyphomicrobiales bacterium]|nr:hypothetical protein [Hyphomicrobiales bacterium]
MSWLDVTRGPIDWHCVYCGDKGELPHHSSYVFNDFTYHLHKCPGCESLIYNPAAMGPGFGLRPDETETRIGSKYYFEVAYSAYFTPLWALATIPDIGVADLKNYNFLDIGAGNGLGSYTIRELFDINVLPVEPSLTGECAREVFGLPVVRKYFEDIEEDLLAQLKSKPCLVHLDAVIEHLNNPRMLLQNLMSSLDIEVLSGLVPDGDGILRDEPFATSVPFLAPSDHVHLPSVAGMDKLFADLGFPFRHVIQVSKLLIVIGSKKPIIPPSDQRVRIATDLVLERLAQHPNPMVSGGAASRLLIDAVGKRKHERIEHFSKQLLPNFKPEVLVRQLQENRPWMEIPFYCSNLSYWVAFEIFAAGRYAEALPYLDVIEVFAERIVRDSAVRHGANDLQMAVANFPCADFVRARTAGRSPCGAAVCY